MIDLIKVDLNTNNKMIEEYIDEVGNALYCLNNISKVNIFIGKNNSGKSRFMRHLLEDNVEFYNLNGTEGFRIKINSFYNSHGLPDDIKEDFKEFVEDENKDNYLIIPVIYKLINRLKDKTRDYYESRVFDEINKIISEIKRESVSYRYYIPILRGIEKFSNTTNKFITNDNTFKLTEGERKLLNKYISQVDNVYNSKVRKNYFEKVSFSGFIHTGENMYQDIQNKLLGKECERNQIKEYERFLSKNFFENKSISLIPNIIEGYLYINIDKDEHELHNFGDGLKQLIIITYNMFMHKDEKAMFFIEEPELNLHPGLQRTLIELMLSDEFKDQQYFITTHSNHLIDLSLDYSNMSIFKFEKIQDNKVKIIQSSKADNDVLQLIGAKPSSVFNSNCTIWVEGITDRLYIRKYLELYQKKNFEEERLREDTDYSFVEYSGGNITHWNFEQEEEMEKINARFLSQNIFVVADNDFPTEGQSKDERLKILEQKLKDNFYKLPVREIENLLTRDILLKAVRIREQDERAFFMPDLNCKTKKYIEGHIGELLEKSVQVSETVRKHKYTYAGTKLLYNKLEFCKIVLNCLTDYDDLSENAKELTELIYNFISDKNK